MYLNRSFERPGRLYPLTSLPTYPFPSLCQCLLESHREAKLLLPARILMNARKELVMGRRAGPALIKQQSCPVAHSQLIAETSFL